jgi:hypothetical protein
MTDRIGRSGSGFSASAVAGKKILAAAVQKV